jgi:hypothetical protein
MYLANFLTYLSVGGCILEDFRIIKAVFRNWTILQVYKLNNIFNKIQLVYLY